MNICIQNYQSMEIQDRDWNNANISLRLKNEEATRFYIIMDAAFSRNPYIDKSHIIRELLELDPPKVLKLEEIVFFRTGDKQGNIINFPQDIQDQPGLHSNPKKVSKKKAEKDAEDRINKIDLDNHDFDYGDFDE